MSGQFHLDWAMMALSLFNVILLLWLSLTVLLNIERRTWAIWLASGGLMLGAAFFISHSAILGREVKFIDLSFRFWMRAGLLPLIILPFAWYLIILWYTGFWSTRDSSLYRRQSGWFVLTSCGLFLGCLGFLVIAFSFLTPLSLFRSKLINLSLANIPILALGYPVYILLCTILSLDALRAPAPSPRIMGDLARQRARPWLMGTSLILLLVGLFVGSAIVLLVPQIRHGLDYYYFSQQVILTIARFDVIISSLIAVATILLGQAIVSYEVFTGKTLPRRGFRRYWYNALVLAAGYGAVVGGALALNLKLVYSLLLSTTLMAVFYALLSWRSYAERERYIEHLRPFVASQQLYEQLLRRTTSGTPPLSKDHDHVMTPFHALCEDVLGAKVAYLVAVGPLAPFMAHPLVYPQTMPSPSLLWLTELIERIRGFQAEQPLVKGNFALPLDPTHYEGALWAVPLWSERGLIGLILLGEKWDDGLYTQEEIEIARASGKRLIDSQASTEMARRLMALQRQRLTESQVLDQQTRRVLHDDVLPTLHTAILTLSSGTPPTTEAMSLLTDVHQQLSRLLRQLPSSTAPQLARKGLLGALQEIVEDEFGRAFDDIQWQIDPQATEISQNIPPLIAEVLFYAAREAIRNAARYGRGEENSRKLCLRIHLSWQNGLHLLIEDDGVGVETATTKAYHEQKSGTGQGLALHSTMMAVIGGSLITESLPERYTRVILALPQGSW